MAGETRIERMVDRLPVSEEKVIASAIAFFVREQDPDRVEFTAYDNGWQLQVYTDKDSSDEAHGFWNEYVAPKLPGAD